MRLIIAFVVVAFVTATAAVYPAAASCNIDGYRTWAKDAFCGTGQRGG